MANLEAERDSWVELLNGKAGSVSDETLLREEFA